MTLFAFEGKDCPKLFGRWQAHKVVDITRDKDGYKELHHAVLSDVIGYLDAKHKDELTEYYGSVANLHNIPKGVEWMIDISRIRIPKMLCGRIFGEIDYKCK